MLPLVEILLCPTPQPISYHNIHAQRRFLSVRRGSPTGVLEHSRVRGSTRRDVFDTEGRDIRRQQDLVVVAAKRGRPQHPPEQPSALPVATMTHENVRGDTPEPGTIPRHSGERRNTKALVTQETKAGGSDRLAKDDIVPGMHEGLGVTLAPAFGDVLGDPLGDAVENPRDKPRLDKVRWVVFPVHQGTALDEGMSAREESKREQADHVSRFISNC